MEHDAEQDWWGDFVQVVRGLFAQANLPSREIAGLCVSGLFPVLCPADEEGRPLRNAILYADSRAAAEVEHAVGLTGTALKGDEVAPKLLWLRHNEPHVFRRTKMLFSVPGYVVYRLTGQYCIDPQTAFRMGGLVDESRCRWREDVCAQLGMPVDSLPHIQPTLHVIGSVGNEAARETGLPEGLPIVVGTTDTTATLLGNGIVEQGEAMIYYGTTGLLTVCSKNLKDVLKTPSLVDDETPFILAAYLLNFGEVLEWFVSQFSEGDRRLTGDTHGPYRALEQGAAQVPPGGDNLLVMPHFAGRVLPAVSPHEKGAFFGLSTRHTRFHLWRALLESFGYEIYRSVVELEGRGTSLSRVVASGGGAQSRLWRQIVSDITGMSQEYVESGDAARGAAFLAGYGVGLIKALGAMREKWLRVEHVTTPCPERHLTYKRLFTVYQALDSALGPHYEALTKVSCSRTDGSQQTRQKRKEG
jgi:xylulokinase